jgi:phenylpropionate dioxygenase-like ring-hydroxylating dioxygenase large terminal subunit
MPGHVRNLWYMAGWEKEVAEEGFLVRTLLDTPMVFYRKGKGDGYVAFVDRCPHRFAPLSRGKRDGDNLICGYHGLKFDAAGTCISNPFSDLIPPGCALQSFPVVAKDSIIWFWAGDPELADPADIGDFACMAGDSPLGRGHLHFEANFELLTDNLMDLSHIEFLHTGSFGGGGVIFEGTHSVKSEGELVWSNWWMPNIAPPPWASFLPPESKVDHWLEMRWAAPASMLLEVGICPAGADRSQSLIPAMIAPHIITPESDGTAHYFYGFPKTAGDDSEDVVGKAFIEEDQPMIEAVQRNMKDSDFWGERPAILQVDQGSVLARRRLMKMRREEAAGVTTGNSLDSSNKGDVYHDILSESSAQTISETVGV